jgi:diadenylate cyclase
MAMLAISRFHWQSAVDFLVLAVALYFLLRWSRQTRALRLALSILALRVAALLARQLDLLITSWVLDAATVITILALLVVFQPELRRAFMRFDIRGRPRQREQRSALSAISTAAWSLAQARCGALIVLAQKDSLAELMTPGIPLNGQISPEVLIAIFQKGSPVHDGAAVIEADVIARVGAILPLTIRTDVPDQYGTRHRAGMGLAERSDALAIVVSEERGEVTLMSETRARLVPDRDALMAALTTLSDRSGTEPVRRRTRPLPQFGLQATAVALAALVWGVTFLFPGRSVQVRTVPVELRNVPPGLIVSGQSSATLQVWLRGSQFLFDTVNLGSVAARCDLSAAHEGVNVIPLSAETVDTPFGITVEALAPRQVRVQLLNASRAPSD